MGRRTSRVSKYSPTLATNCSLRFRTERRSLEWPTAFAFRSGHTLVEDIRARLCVRIDVLEALFGSFPVFHESAKARLIETNGTNASFLPRPVQTGVMAI